jgi:NAD(P)H-flavin reductase
MVAVADLVVGGLPGPAAVDPFLPTLHRVTARARETADTVTLALVPIDGDPAGFTPGQFNMLGVLGVGEAPISISGASGLGGPLLHTIRAVGTVSGALHGSRVGDVIGVRGPYGTGWDVAGAAGRDVVVVAGGIGLAPLRGAIRELVEERHRFGHVAVLVGTRSPEALLYRREVRAWRSRFDLDVRITVDFATPGWAGPVGLVTNLIPGAVLDPAQTTALLCGPEVMMRYSAAALIDRGVARGDIRLSVERNMKCGIGLCGHCQLGPLLLCRDGAVVTYDRVAPLLDVSEL